MSDEGKFTRPYPYVIDNRESPLCHHDLGDGSSIVVAADGCSLECTACRKIIVAVEPISVVIDGDDIDWVD